MPASNEEFIKRAFEAGLSEEQVRAAVAERNRAISQPQQTAQQSPNLLQQAGGAIKAGIDFLAPRITQGVPKVVQAVQQGQQMGPQGIQPTEAIGALTGPLGAYLSTQTGLKMPERQREAYAMGAEAANYILPVKGASQLAAAGAARGLSEGISSPKDVSLLDRAISATGMGALGFGLGKATEGVIGLFKGDKIKEMGNNLITSQYNAPRSAANAMKLRKTVDDLAQYGITNIDNIQPAAEKVTGANGVISKVTREAAAQAKPLDTTGLRSIAASIASDPNIKPGTDTKLVKYFIEQSKSDPMEALDAIRGIEAKAAGILKGKMPQMISAEDKALSDAYYSFADELKNRLYDAGAGKAAVNLIKDPKNIAALAEVSPELAKRASQITSLDQLRSLAAPFVRGSQLADITASGQAYGFQNLQGQAKGFGKLLQNPLNILALPLSSNAVSSNIGGAIRNVGQAGARMASGIENISPALQAILQGALGRP